MSNPILELIEQQNEINEKAWVTFSEDYERRNPQPEVKKNTMWFRAIAIGSIASLTVSGSFTIPAFFNISMATGTLQVVAFFVGFFGFVMVDVMAMIGSHKLVDLAYRPQALAGKVDNRLMIVFVSVMTAFAFVVGVTSNLYYMMYGFGVLVDGSQGLQNLAVFLGVLMALAPPILSSATGAIIALEPLQTIIEREAYEKARNSAWGRFKSKQGITLDIDKLTERYMDKAMDRLEAPVSEVSVADTGGRTGWTNGTASANGRTGGQADGQADASAQVQRYFEEHPADRGKSVRELAEIIGVGKTTVAKVKRELFNG